MKMKIEREYQTRKQKMQRYNDPFWWLTVVFKEVGFTEVDRNPGDEALSIELSYYHNYDEHAILELLEALLPYTSEGCISYCCEEGDYRESSGSDGGERKNSDNRPIYANGRADRSKDSEHD